MNVLCGHGSLDAGKDVFPFSFSQYLATSIRLEAAEIGVAVKNK